MNKNDFIPGKSILLFYKEYEADKFILGDRYLKRILRPLYNLLHHRQKATGFFVSFTLLHKALTRSGYHVHVNDHRLARSHPDYPVGLVGFPLLLDGWSLPNPAVLGPSLYDHPMLAPDLMRDERYRKFATLAQWTYDMYHPVYGDTCFKWFAGIDCDEWPDLSGAEKEFDFLVYDKIRWDHDAFETSMINPIFAELEKRGLTYTTLRYKFHDHEVYKNILSKARGMIFLCEHETQGLAYQEAMASNVPILAWDNGYWLDPLWKRFQAHPQPASSVPFFSTSCGEKFAGIAEFPEALTLFMKSRETYAPREYVKNSLSLAESARIYAESYFSLIKSA